jgi:hypothetical protein
MCRAIDYVAELAISGEKRNKRHDNFLVTAMTG